MLTGIESLGWRLFADGCKKRNIDGTEMSRLGCPIVSPENFVWVMCGPVVCDARLLAFLGATSCSNNTTELSGFAEAIRWAKFFILRVCSFAHSFLNPNTRSVLLLALPTLQRTFLWTSTFNELILRLTCNVPASSHHVYGHAVNTGNECADAAVSLGMKAFVSENNVPIFWPEEVFQFNAFSKFSTVSHRSPSGYTLLVHLQFQLQFACVSCLSQLRPLRHLFRNGRRPGMGFRAAPTHSLRPGINVQMWESQAKGGAGSPRSPPPSLLLLQSRKWASGASTRASGASVEEQRAQKEADCSHDLRIFSAHRGS